MWDCGIYKSRWGSEVVHDSLSVPVTQFNADENRTSDRVLQPIPGCTSDGSNLQHQTGILEPLEHPGVRAELREPCATYRVLKPTAASQALRSQCSFKEFLGEDRPKASDSFDPVHSSELVQFMASYRQRKKLGRVHLTGNVERNPCISTRSFIDT